MFCVRKPLNHPAGTVRWSAAVPRALGHSLSVDGQRAVSMPLKDVERNFHSRIHLGDGALPRRMGEFILVASD